MKIHDIKNKLPKDYKSVLLFNKNDNEWVIGYLVTGISRVERNELSNDNERKHSFRFGDECDNNLVPYEFKGAGPISYFGQYITHWCKLPKKIKKEISKNNTIDFDNSNINLFKRSWGGRGNYLLARAREIVIHNLRPLGLCWIVQEQHLFMDNSERIIGIMLEATIEEPNAISKTYRLTIKGLNDDILKHGSTLNYDLSIIDNSSEKDIVIDNKTYANKEEIIIAIKELFKDYKCR